MAQWDRDAARTAIERAVEIGDRNGWRKAGTPIDLAIDTEPGVQPDRASFLSSLQAAGYAVSISVDMDLRIEFIQVDCGPSFFDVEPMLNAEEPIGKLAHQHGYVVAGHSFADR